MTDSNFKIEKPAVEPVKIITIDNTPYAVDTMSDEVQEMVKVFNRWNDAEAGKQHELNILGDQISMLQAAKDTVSRQILEKVREDNAAKENAEAEAPAVVEEGGESK
jgi:hypothetical protein